jgi:glycine hydroxymethyltransferase
MPIRYNQKGINIHAFHNDQKVTKLRNAKDYYKEVFHLLKQHHALFRQAIPLVASENVPSPAVREAIVSDIGNRYAEGWVGERVYAGCEYIDQVESLCIELAKNIFSAEFVDARPISGVVANLSVYAAFTEPGDHMLALSIPSGGHISHGKKRFGGTAGAISGLNVEYLVLNHQELNIDIDETVKSVKELVKAGKTPKLVMFGGSVFLFPHPVKELEEYFHSIGATVVYDAAHVAGLIAGGTFQDPLREGSDVVTLSTHKTIPGPQHGMILSWEKYAERIKNATFPGVVSNHHLQNVAGVAVALAEMQKFGREYAKQIIKNAKALGQALYERGFKVLAEDKGFTESHTLLVDITDYGDGGQIEKELENANIIINRNLLPWDIREGRHYRNPGGIRLGTSEVTRLGMKEEEMEEIAEFFKRVIVDKEPLGKVKNDVTEFRKGIQKVHFCFDKLVDAYEYVEIK